MFIMMYLLPFPNWIKSTRFDVIILDVTFLSLRWAPRKKFEKIKSKYSFVADSKALKIAFLKTNMIVVTYWINGCAYGKLILSIPFCPQT